MSGRIPEDIIEQVRTASDIVDVVSQYLTLKKRGRNYMACCPFHTEKTPSFSVSPDKQIYHCFGCGKGGNAFSFLMEHENMSFIEAVKLLAEKAGIRIPENKVDDKYKEELDRIYYANQVALDYFKDTLNSKQYKDKMFKYLYDNRKLTDESIDLFQFGLAGDSWDGFRNHALKKGFFPKELVKAGLLGYNEQKDSFYDRFRLRLIIPIFNMSGKAIAFGGRALKKGEYAKYINSPETPLYNKSAVLYGLNFTKQEIRNSNEVIIVEGYFDLISLYQHGVKNVVASSGTAFTPQQARLLARFAENAYLFFDSDSAGQKAAVRSVDALYDAGMEVKVMVPPDGEDPDSYARKKGADGINELKDSALRYLDYRVKDFDFEKEGIIAREKLIKELAELGGRINDPTRRELFINETSALLNIQKQTVNDLIENTPDKDKTEKKAEKNKGPRKLVDFERDILSLLLNFPDYFNIAFEKLGVDDLQNDRLNELYQAMHDEYQVHGSLNLSRMIDDVADPKLKSAITYLANIEWENINISQIINDYIKNISNFKRNRQIDDLTKLMEQAQSNGESDLAKQLIKEIEELRKKIV